MLSRQAKLNEFNRQQILERIVMLTRGCTTPSSRNLLTELNRIRDTLNMQSPAATRQAYECDAKIRNYLNAIQGDIAAQSWNVADIRIEKIKQVLSERATLSIGGSDALMTRQEKRQRKRDEREFAKWQKKNKIEDFASSLSIDELYKDDELYSLNVARLQDAIQREEEKRTELVRKQERDPYNEAIISNIEVADDKIAGLRETLNVYTDERKRASYIASLRQAPAARKEAIATRTYSDEEAQYIIGQHDVTMEEMSNDFVLQARAQGRGTGRTAPSRTATATTGGVGGARASGSASDQVRMRREIEDIRKAVSQLEQYDQHFMQKLQDCDVELREVEAQLRPLLERRKQLTPSQRSTIDSQIDSLNAKRNRIVTTIKQISQAKSINLDKLNLVANKQQWLEILNSTDLANVNVAGIDFQQIAMELREAAIEGNRKLDEIGTAVAVSQSEEIRSGAMSGTMQANSESLGEFSDSKYDDLEKQLGLV